MKGKNFFALLPLSMVACNDYFDCPFECPRGDHNYYDTGAWVWGKEREMEYIMVIF